MPLRGAPARLVNGSDFDVDLGLMRDRVTLQSVTRTKGSGGFATDAPVTEVRDIPCEFTPEVGGEPYQMGAQRGQATFRLRIRYREGVTAGWLAVVRGQTYQVLETPLNLDARRRFLWLRVGRVEG